MTFRPKLPYVFTYLSNCANIKSTFSFFFSRSFPHHVIIFESALTCKQLHRYIPRLHDLFSSKFPGLQLQKDEPGKLMHIFVSPEHGKLKHSSISVEKIQNAFYQFRFLIQGTTEKQNPTNSFPKIYITKTNHSTLTNFAVPSTVSGITLTHVVT